jgi:hypothetical protein
LGSSLVNANLDILIFGVATLVVVQLFVSLRVLLTREYTPVQKAWQLVIIWVVPFFGAVFVRSFLVSDRSQPRDRDTSFITDGGGNPPGINQQ